jgi:hypothetical protein
MPAVAGKRVKRWIDEGRKEETYFKNIFKIISMCSSAPHIQCGELEVQYL